MNIGVRDIDRVNLSSSGDHKTITVLGSTGSIGCNTLDLIAREPEKYTVKALTANSNVAELAKQAKEHKAEMAVIADDSKLDDLKTALSGTNIIAAAGKDALNEAADMPADWVMSSIVGAAGLRPTLTAVRRGATIALANKECLVCAGEFMMEQVDANNATLLPVDSEHNAIFQVFDFDEAEKVDKITLTASGGPFWNRDVSELGDITPEEAVKHPNWSMGAKISVDSATMMNKGLELIEAFYMFPVEKDQLDIIIHPQSIIHSMVSYIDGSVLAQLGTPDMRIPISYTLGWPHRIKTPSKKLDLTEIGKLEFIKPDEVKFPSINITREVLQKGGSAPTILNASNEVAVSAFLNGKIRFLDIAKIVGHTLDKITVHHMNSLSDVHDVDEEARIVAGEIITGFTK
ncbi:1-deoxy-D-xylulose-5-phosphate reductoisomerase [Pseudemcibacter aquimaris]|uniref:1-deoxy-D-xylulose-5-phosphate reductoisomerase n=1 Tax=Pseudemcibacter aquimaris TaxID=2857064 RepID=UPI0020125090|nr:1-deoxy-D-xylulose-5-phosphate reductoisomerase [Pseudemcibacter aquimaris]MCC3860887.1 1-deoxy-D-xylulose-5-phosphate reductoisomerase [Pseudemcibacter aquimaris]WDU59705.1 1-deoxy-D-xylulose-5-phosphate reductoisomerase [Pseudemcibacter aquimaris]